MTFVALAVAALVTGCSDYNVSLQGGPGSVGALIELNPTTLVFSADVGQTESKTFTARSVGNATLHFEPLELDAPGDFTLPEGEVPSLAPGEEADVTVVYTALAASAEGRVIVPSNADDDPRAAVELVAGAGAGALVVEPDPKDFGEIPVGVTTESEVDLVNTGSSSVVVTALSVTSGVFGYTDPGLPLTLDAGDRFPLTVSFTPSAEGEFNALLKAEHAGGAASGLLEGVGVPGETGRPVAVCSVDPPTVLAFLDEATWIGSASYDPDGKRLTTYQWTLLSKPPGSAVAMPGGTGADRGPFLTDLAGTYVAELVVVNEDGERSDPCQATLEAIPGQDLWVEMYWSRSGDDMDLHLLAPGGSFNDWKDDCYYLNCVPLFGFRLLDWGVRGDSADDPSLDFDDIPGTGPENINIYAPEVGTFTVVVHDYPGTVFQGANDVTVNIYLSGVLAWTDTRTITGEDTTTEFAAIDTATWTVTSL